MRVSDEKIIEIFSTMIQLDTTNDEQAMTDYIGGILDSHGIHYEIIEPSPGRTNLISRLGAEPSEATEPPVLFISHTDVVDCENQNWSVPPFSAEERDGMIYGRGTLDTKYLTAMQLAACIEHKDTPLPFPLYFIATADEERGSTHGMPHVVTSYGKAFLHGRVINEGGGFLVHNNRTSYYLCTAGEKGRCTVQVSIEGTAGPASFRTEGKAVDRYVMLLQRIMEYTFEEEETGVAGHFREVLGETVNNPFLKKFDFYNSHDAFSLRSVNIGRQVNVLPSMIKFDLEIQMLPGRKKEKIISILDELFEGIEGASWEITAFQEGFESDLTSSFFKTMEETALTYYPGEALLPVYALGRTDGRFLGTLPSHVWGFAPVSEAIGFTEVLRLVHQENEHIDRDSVILGTRFLSDLLTKTGNRT